MMDLEKTVLGIELGSTRIKAALRRCLPILEKTAASIKRFKKRFMAPEVREDCMRRVLRYSTQNGQRAFARCLFNKMKHFIEK